MPPPHTSVKVCREFTGGCCCTQGSRAISNRCIGNRQARLQSLENHCTTNSIAAIAHCTWAKKNLGRRQGKGVERYNVLQITRTEYSAVHSHTIYAVEQAIGRKAAYHWATATILAFLYKDLSTKPQKVGSCLRVISVPLLKCRTGNLVWHTLTLLTPTIGSHHHLVEADAVQTSLCRYKVHRQEKNNRDNSFFHRTNSFPVLAKPASSVA